MRPGGPFPEGGFWDEQLCKKKSLPDCFILTLWARGLLFVTCQDLGIRS